MSRKQKTPDMSNHVRKFVKVFVDQCKLNSARNYWATFPDSLNDDVRRNIGFFQRAGFKINEDWPHAGNGHSVSPKGEINIYWNDGKMDMKILQEVLNNADEIESLGGSYVVKSPPTENNTYVWIAYDQNTTTENTTVVAKL